jgi:ABC-type glycerol-3-phosphate transport system substrate-binding protein
LVKIGKWIFLEDIMKVKCFVLVLSVVLMVSLTAGNVFAGGRNDSAKGGIKEVICMIQSGPDTEILKTITDAYNAEPGHEGYKIVISDVGGEDTWTKIQTLLLAKSSNFDFCGLIPSYVAGMAEAGALEPLDSYFADPAIKAKGFSPSVFTDSGIKNGTYKDTLYSLPFGTSTMYLYYRKDLIPNPPQTWEEYRRTAEQFTRSRNPNSPTAYGTTIMGGTGSANNVNEVAGIVWSMGSDFVTASGQNKVNSPENVWATDFWAGLYKDKLVPPDCNTYGYGEVLNALKEEQVAMAIEWDAADGELTDPAKSPKVYNKLGFAPVRGSGSKTAVSSACHLPRTGCSISINSRTIKKKLLNFFPIFSAHRFG